ncbi:glycosyltransferase family 2 protein, partial [Actinoplanes philippinensis]|uniref:glycosyltransferase family 2 protein n=1 Tax=Actinoplanes philippinensis TaxID=35752 RepID=UPI0033DC78EF
MNTVSVVVPTLGRPSLTGLLRALGPLPAGMELIIVDDRPEVRTPLDLPSGSTARVVAGRRAGPAAARNAGWRAARHEWVAFLDDDVLPEPGWAWRLLGDLREAGPEVGGVQGRIRVPRPEGRRPTDWERVTAGLADGEWITADMAYRRAALTRTGGFDERLPRAFREDAELAHRVRRAGWQLRAGQRSTTHPVRPEARWISLRLQRGNADDALLRRIYGPSWRTTLGIPPGRRHRHALITACLAAAAACTAAHLLTRRPASSRPGATLAVGSPVGRAFAGGSPVRRAVAGDSPVGRALAARASAGRAFAGRAFAGRLSAGDSLVGRSSAGRPFAGRPFAGRPFAGRPFAGRSFAGRSFAGRSFAGRGWAVAAGLAAAGWVAGTAEFAAARILPGPRDRREVTTMVLTSVAIPPVAIVHWVRGWFRWRGAGPLPPTAAPTPTRITAPTSAITLPGAGEPPASASGRDRASARNVVAARGSGSGGRVSDGVVSGDRISGRGVGAGVD